MRKPKIVDRLAYKTIANETIVLDSKINQQVHQLNELASFIWNLCDGEHDVAQIVNQECNEFEVSTEIASQDVSAFLSELESKNLLLDVSHDL